MSRCGFSDVERVESSGFLRLPSYYLLITFNVNVVNLKLCFYRYLCKEVAFVLSDINWEEMQTLLTFILDQTNIFLAGRD